MITYSQNFEDVMLARLFQGQETGFYVDVGAWHPELLSVTKHFYDSGWTGINLEPIARQHELLQMHRPRDLNLNVAVGDKMGRMLFFECIDHDALSTADASQAEALRNSGYDVRSYEVDVVTLASLAPRIASRTIDFLKVDVEGLEERVLRGANWKKMRPRVLVIEATQPVVSILDWDNIDAIRNWEHWEPWLLKQGYVFAWYDGLSRFYIREEERDLARRLAIPPGAHDHLRFPKELALVRELEEVRGDQRAKESLITTLTTEIASINADRKAKDIVLSRLNKEFAAVHADREAKGEVVARLGKELEAIGADREAKDAVLARLGSEIAAIDADRRAKDEVLARLSGEIVAIDADRGAKDDVIARLGKEIADADARQKANDDTIARLGKQVAASDAASRTADEKIALLEHKVATIDADRKAKDAVIARVKRESAAIDADRKAKDAVIARLGDQIVMIDADRKAKDEVIARLGDQIVMIDADRKAKDDVIARLGNQIATIDADRKAKDDVIAQLGNQIATIDAERKAKDDVIVRQNARIEAGDKDRRDKENANAKLAEHLVSTKQEVIELASQLEARDALLDRMPFRVAAMLVGKGSARRKPK
jgi:FkbM family methyltransferase